MSFPKTLRAFQIALVYSSLSILAGASNVTTIFRLNQTSTGEYLKFGTWSVVASGADRGFPLRRGEEGIAYVGAVQPCCDSWDHDGWIKLADNDPATLNAPLNKRPLQPAIYSDLNTDTSPEFVKIGATQWKITLPLTRRARLSFTPSTSDALVIFFCENDWHDNGVLISLIARKPQDQMLCKVIHISGSDEEGKTLRYQVKNTKLAVSSYPYDKFFKEDNRVTEEWPQINRTYYLQMERTSNGDLEIRLERGNPKQRDSMTLIGGLNTSHIGISMFNNKNNSSDNSGRLFIFEDPAWRGQLLPGGRAQIYFKPAADGSGHLGFALCEDRLQDNCKAKVLDGHKNGSVITDDVDSPFWIAGFQGPNKTIPESSANAHWDPNRLYEFILHRSPNGTVIIRLKSPKRRDAPWRLHWTVPLSHQHLTIDSYQSKGTFSVDAAAASISAPVWQLDNSLGFGEIVSPRLLKSSNKSEVCVFVAARFGTNSAFSVGVALDTQVFFHPTDSQWMVRRVVFSLGPPEAGKPGKPIVITGDQPENTTDPVLIQWGGLCDTDSQEDEYNLGYSSESSVVNEVGFEPNLAPRPITDPQKLIKNPVCANDGLLDVSAGKCLCRPGFAGKLCKRGCGPNRFGEECESKCSDGDNESNSRQCRGMWLCTPNLSCNCAPGLTGKQCNDVCKPGWWGNGCRNKCGLCMFDEPCDPYTGACKGGCHRELQPPLCTEECGVFHQNFEQGAWIKISTWEAGIFSYHLENNVSTDSSTSIENIAAGTLLTPTLVISAAHIFYNEEKDEVRPAENYKVAFGKVLKDWDADEDPESRVQKRNVAHIYVSDDYRGRFLAHENDIALLELDEPVEITHYVKPVCYDFTGQYEEPALYGKVGYIDDWERPSTGDSTNDKTIRAPNTLVPRSECWKNGISFGKFISSSDKLCGLHATRVSDNYVPHGARGGGLVFQQNDYPYFLRGILSVGTKYDQNYTLYTNVSYHRNWINEIRQQIDLRRAIQSNYKP